MESNLKDNELIIKDDHGKTHKYEIIATVHSKENQKDYIIFTDNRMDADGCTIAYANIYDKNGFDQNLYPIETESEWEFIEKLLANFESS